MAVAQVEWWGRLREIKSAELLEGCDGVSCAWHAAHFLNVWRQNYLRGGGAIFPLSFGAFMLNHLSKTLFYGADGGGRTHTLLRVLDFESSASANSATSATKCELQHITKF